jgi:predicted outer membrane repeat protein
MRARWLVTRWFVGLLFVLLGGVSVLAPGTVVRAATINVPADQPTIQAAINAAAPNDTIVIAAGTYMGTGNVGVTVNKAVTILGAGAGQTIIDGQHSSQAFNVTATGVAIGNLTIQNGGNVLFPGGAIAIANGGALTVTDTTFSGNTETEGGGIFNDIGGTLMVTGSTFSGNGAVDSLGGGISSSGTLTVTNSTFSANIGAEGGAIFNVGGTLTVTNSTFSGNSIPSTPSSTGGGGIANTGTMFVTNSTFSGNFDTVGGGGALYNEGTGTLTMTNSTFSGNFAPAGGGGGILNRGALTLTNTLIASSTTSSDLAQQGGSLTGSNNLLDDAAIGTGFSDNDANHNIVGHPALLGALDAYGSANGIQTFALLPGSPAIDKGVAAGQGPPSDPVPAADQRGIARVGIAPDIGAFESQGFTFSTLTGTPQSALINTQFATPLGVTVIATAPGEPVDGGQVAFTVTPVGGASATLATSPATIAGGTASVTATANGVVGGPYTVTPSASGVSGTATFSLTNTALTAPISLVVTNTNETAAADAACIVGNCSLRQAVNASNANDPGVGNHNTITFTNGLNGTVMLANGTLTLTRSVTIDGSGATIAVDGNHAVTVFAMNSGVTVAISTLTIQNGNSGNGNGGFGGGINNFGGALTVTNSTFTGNSTSGNGGGIFSTGTLTVTNSTFSANSASGGGGSGGGGIFSTSTGGGTLTVTNSILSGNSTSGNGGGIFSNNSGGGTTVTNTLLAGNTAPSGQGPDASGAFTSGGGNLIGIVDAQAVGFTQPTDLKGTPATPLNPLLGTLGAYGGPTQTFPLLPGSPAIDKGVAAGAPAADQRGKPRVGAPDTGAFESQGFTFSTPTGTPQSTAVGTQFVTPLGVTVTANAPIEPVNGGQIIFTVTPVGGATASLATSPATISGGTASVTATANGTAGGPYTVTPSANGVSGTATFSLTNTRGPVTSIVLTGPGGATALTLKVGETVQLTATATYADHSTQVLPAVQLVWQSGDSAKVAVDANGNATGLSAGGPVTVTATQGGVTGQIAVTVATPVLTGVQPAPAPASRPGGANAPTGGSPTPAPLPSGPVPGGAGPAPHPNPPGR